MNFAVNWKILFMGSIGLIGLLLALFFDWISLEMYQDHKELLSRIFLAIAWIVFFISTSYILLFITIYG